MPQEISYNARTFDMANLGNDVRHDAVLAMGRVDSELYLSVSVSKSQRKASARVRDNSTVDCVVQFPYWHDLGCDGLVRLIGVG